MQENSWTFTLKYENNCFRESDPQNCLSHKEHSLTFRILYGLVHMEYYSVLQLHCTVHGSEILQWKIPDWGRNRKIWRKKKIYRRTLLYCTVQHGWESLQWEIDFLWRHSSPQRCILHIIKSRRGGIQIWYFGYISTCQLWWGGPSQGFMIIYCSSDTLEYLLLNRHT